MLVFRVCASTRLTMTAYISVRRRWRPLRGTGCRSPPSPMARGRRRAPVARSKILVDWPSTPMPSTERLDDHVDHFGARADEAVVLDDGRVGWSGSSTPPMPTPPDRWHVPLISRRCPPWPRCRPWCRRPHRRCVGGIIVGWPRRGAKLHGWATAAPRARWCRAVASDRPPNLVGTCRRTGHAVAPLHLATRRKPRSTASSRHVHRPPADARGWPRGRRPASSLLMAGRRRLDGARRRRDRFARSSQAVDDGPAGGPGQVDMGFFREGTW